MNVVNRTFAGLVGAVGGVGAELARQVGRPENEAEQVEHAFMGMAESYMFTGPHGVQPTKASVKFWQDKQVQNLVDATKIAAPYIAEGKRPPPGLHPLIDDLYAEEAKADAKNLDDALRESKKTATGERAPEALAHFIRGQTNAEIGISADAIRRIYGETQPEAEDGKLGWIPDIVSQLRSAEANGGDVKVPLADWLANVKPELAKELREDIRVRPGGMTLTEVALAKEQEEAEPKKEFALKRTTPAYEGQQVHQFDIISDDETVGSLEASTDAEGKKLTIPGFDKGWNSSETGVSSER